MKLRSIQILRAVAVLLVIYMHSLDFQPDAIHFRYLPAFGAFGVDLFFVISGFIITYSAGRYIGSKEAGRFLSNRFWRLIPVYWLATVLFILVQMRYVLRPGAAGLSSFPVVLKTIILLPLDDSNIFILPFLSVAWTLSFEWLFYLIFFIGIIASVQNKATYLCWILAALVVLGFCWRIHDARWVFLTNPILLEFALGAAICSWYMWRVAHPTKGAVSQLLAATLLLSGIAVCIVEICLGFGGIAVMEDIVSGRLSLLRFVAWGIPAALIVAGCIFLETRGAGERIWNNRFFGLIGNASYSIYLMHLPVYGLFLLLHRRTEYFLDPNIAVFLQVAGAIVGGLIFYVLVERPLVQKRKHVKTA